jgi:hypothetical protein
VPPDLHPGAVALDHRSGATGISWVEIVGDRARFEEWTQGEALPVRITNGGPPKIRAVALATPAGDLVLG